MPDPYPADLVPRILFEDTHVIVLDKPAGLLSQGERTGDANLVDWLRGYLGRNYVGLVHRLDRNTSGAIVVGKRSKAAERLTVELQSGRLHRSYLAWLEGRLEAEARWSHRLWKDSVKNTVRVVSSSHPQGKDAVLRVRPIGYGALGGRPLTLAQFELETGRSHQIRVQAAHQGFPLLGDRKYSPRGRAFVEDFPRPALHSHRVAFEHPMTRATIELEAPIPQDFRRIPGSETIFGRSEA